jgi:hypothetical protein
MPVLHFDFWLMLYQIGGFLINHRNKLNVKSANPRMTLDLLRHGEPEGGRLYRGNLLDNPLSEKGWQQMQASVNGKHSISFSESNTCSSIFCIADKC